MGARKGGSQVVPQLVIWNWSAGEQTGQSDITKLMLKRARGCLRPGARARERVSLAPRRVREGRSTRRCTLRRAVARPPARLRGSCCTRGHAAHARSPALRSERCDAGGCSCFHRESRGRVARGGAGVAAAAGDLPGAGRGGGCGSAAPRSGALSDADWHCSRRTRPSPSSRATQRCTCCAGAAGRTQSARRSWQR